jgi:hypothetical protein
VLNRIHSYVVGTHGRPEERRSLPMQGPSRICAQGCKKFVSNSNNASFYFVRSNFFPLPHWATIDPSLISVHSVMSTCKPAVIMILFGWRNEISLGKPQGICLYSAFDGEFLRPFYSCNKLCSREPEFLSL